MSPLLGPILAQLVTLGVADRTEARYVVNDEHYAEVATSPNVRLNLGWKQATLTFGYGPSITVTPLEAKDPSVIVFHAATFALSNRWARTLVTASESFGDGRVDFIDQAIADPRTGPNVTVPTGTGAAPGGGTPPVGTGTTATGTTGTVTQPGNVTGNQIPAAGHRIVRFYTSTTAINASQLVSTTLTLSGGIFYQASGGDTFVYPAVRGPGARIAAAYAPTRLDTVTSSLNTQIASSSGTTLANGTTFTTGNNAWVLFENEAWVHQFSKATTSNVSAGLSLTRNSQPDGTIYYSIYPNFGLGITTSTLLGRSTLTFGSNVTSAPFIDPVLALVDPRLSAAIFSSLRRGPFMASLYGSSAISLQTHNDNKTFDALSAGLALAYVLGKNVSIDTGVRESYQTYGGATAIPLSVAAYVGMTIGALVPLNGTH